MPRRHASKRVGVLSQPARWVQKPKTSFMFSPHSLKRDTHAFGKHKHFAQEILASSLFRVNDNCRAHTLKPHRKHGLNEPFLRYMHLNRFSWSWMNFQNLWIGFSKPIETKGKNNAPQRFQILQTFQVQKEILEGYSFLPKESLEKWGFKIATAYASLLSSLLGTFKKTWT